MLPRLVFAALLLAPAPITPGLAQSYGQSEAQAAELDVLFRQLAAATDGQTARGIADDIWQIWIHPHDPVLDARVAEIMSAGGVAGPAGQIPLIDALVAEYPDYAEGWNLRATAHFLNGAYEQSLADIAATLDREPRHFGALSGRALIYHAQGKRDLALEAITAALDIHPFLAERALFPELGPPPIRS